MIFYFFQKEMRKTKIRFLQCRCQCRCRVADAEISKSPFVCDIPTLMQSIFYKSVASYLMHVNCMLYTSTGNYVLATTIKINSLGNLTCVSRSLNSHRFTRCFPFRSLNRFEHLPIQFFSRLLATIDEKNLVLRKISFIFLNQVFYFIIEILCLLVFV